jgi:membrane associated rhomboid family serine protease
MNMLNNIQTRFKNANIVEQFIYINLGVFFLVFLINTLGFLFQANENFIVKWFSLPASFDTFITKPWTLITYGFLHVGFIHVLGNLIALYFVGNLFIEYFTQKQFLNFYFLGTFFGGLIFLLSYNYFPVFSIDVHISVLMGASAGVSAIFIGIATYIPNYKIKFPLIGFVKLWQLAAFWIILDIIQMPAGNAGGNLSHIGGALFGFLYVHFAGNKKINLFSNISNPFKRSEKPLKTVYKSKKKTTSANTKPSNQKQIDSILDKISKSGYDTLNAEEKAFLFQQGKK